MAFIIDNKDTILSIIDGWKGKLTIALLSEALQRELGLKKRPNRGTFESHPEIKHAFKLKKKALKENKELAVQEARIRFESSDKLSDLLSDLNNEDATIAELIKCVEKQQTENEKLHSENRRLKDQNNMLMERFARWQYNLNKMDGVNLNKLSQEIDKGWPAKNRH